MLLFSAIRLCGQHLNLSWSYSILIFAFLLSSFHSRNKHNVWQHKLFSPFAIARRRPVNVSAMSIFTAIGMKRAHVERQNCMLRALNE